MFNPVLATDARKSEWGKLWPLLVITAYGVLYLAASYLSFMTGWSFTLCMLKNLTGIPCPFCGSTRAALSLLYGNFHSAFLFNPLGCALILLAPLAFIGYHAFWRPRGQKLRLSPWLWVPLISAIILGNWAYLIIIGR